MTFSDDGTNGSVATDAPMTEAPATEAPAEAAEAPAEAPVEAPVEGGEAAPAEEAPAA